MIWNFKENDQIYAAEFNEVRDLKSNKKLVPSRGELVVTKITIPCLGGKLMMIFWWTKRGREK